MEQGINILCTPYAKANGTKCCQRPNLKELQRISENPKTALYYAKANDTFKCKA